MRKGTMMRRPTNQNLYRSLFLSFSLSLTLIFVLFEQTGETILFLTIFFSKFVKETDIVYKQRHKRVGSINASVRAVEESGPTAAAAVAASVAVAVGKFVEPIESSWPHAPMPPQRKTKKEDSKAAAAIDLPLVPFLLLFLLVFHLDHQQEELLGNVVVIHCCRCGCWPWMIHLLRWRKPTTTKKTTKSGGGGDVRFDFPPPPLRLLLL